MAVVTAANMTGYTEALDITGGESAPGAGDATGYGESLKEAGIAQLAYAKKVAEDTGSAVTAVRAISGDWSDNMNADGSYKSVADGGVALTIKGIKLSDWVAAGAAGDASALSDDQKHCRKASEAKFKLVPLFAAPTMDWETAYPNGGASQASKVGVAMEGKCPWLEAGSFRYYICIFKVYEDGAAAKLLATACPECGILDADSF
ncbi:hypothetical protein SDC9_149475 [bioreactor metagenome]|uniref:Uncharacterized protein n=1 Tax=bioreactor metagenome TaxID=1076179 RepID=A0A645EJV5_9ZZZZ